ncbi:MAG: SLOG family protein, partial [Eubacteriales bacterium]|nr:SLOG family protein [Eubacteriales bacterium]
MIDTRARENTCCFTGHRPDKLPWGLDENSAECRKLRIEIAIQLEALHSAGIAHFISGMALGCDLLFAEAVLAMREEYDDVTLEAAVPCDSQANSWPEEQKERYNAILSSCDTVTFVQHQSPPGCMLR